MNTSSPIIKKIALLLAVLLCVLGTGFLTGTLLLGSPGAPQVQQRSQLELSKRFTRNVTNSLSDALREVPSVTLTIDVQKEYWLSDEDLVAPEPNPDCYGFASSPAELEPVIEQAAELLDGQSLVFDTQVTISPDSEIVYYLDETIFVITWKEMYGDREYAFSEVKIQHPSQFRRFLSGGTYGSGVLYTATDMAASVNAVTASSADYYAYRPFGNTVHNGAVMRCGDKLLDTCYIDTQGDLHLIRAGQMTEKEQIEAYIKENNIRFSLAFGPILLENGELIANYYYPIGEVTRAYSRAALCQQGPLHYVLVTANYGGADIVRFAQTLQAKGILTAYTLDGGQTATIVTGDQLINRVDYGGQREISDIIYFATAIPNGG